MSKEYKGSCLCGKVQFSVTHFSNNVANCHCSMCRKFHGAAFGTLVGVQGLIWLSGKPLLKDFMKSVDISIIGKPFDVSVKVDNQKLIAVNSEIRNHPIETVGATLRASMTAMKKINECV